MTQLCVWSVDSWFVYDPNVASGLTLENALNTRRRFLPKHFVQTSTSLHTFLYWFADVKY